MAKLLQLRRGNDTDHSTFTGADGELTYNTTTKTLHVHDGSTTSGSKILSRDTAKSYGHLGSATTGINAFNIDLSVSNNIKVNVALVPASISFSNCTEGQSGSIFFVFNGSSISAWSNQFIWNNSVTPTSSFTIGAVDRLDYIVYDDTPGSEKVHCNYTAGL